ncbi:MAG: trypsin-like peptidase domain-containing protein [Candidatus Thermoplasmatota archaeon]|nr:trypsin-like peptidase domain-containing protein [Candidatus Thermoplasmatota archaeon]
MEPNKSIQDGIFSAVERIRDAVVSVDSSRINYNGYGVAPVKGSGSGIIVSSSGYIVTNNHVIQDSENVMVRTPDGQEYDGYVIGGDSATDIAVVKIEKNGLKYAELGDSDSSRVGQIVLAVGNALGLPGGPTVSMGVIGAIGRPMPWADFIFEGLIQTDAAINPGNSGGPLVDLYGNVIGINTAMIPFAQGMGFSIPSNTVKRVMKEVLEHGRIIRPYLGISGISLNKDVSRQFGIRPTEGVLIVRVSRNSPAHYAGMQRGDVITSIGETSVKGIKDLLEQLSKHRPEETVRITILRGGKPFEARARLSVIEPDLFPVNE